MSARLPTGGRLIDRDRPLRFTLDGRGLTGLAGDTLASALLANGRTLVGRSFKYHRPRGIVASGPEEPNALFGLGRGDRFEPNARATQVPLAGGLVATSQNRWPSLARDVGALNARLARFLPAGFYYKTFMWPRGFWKSVYEPAIRQAAGLGRAPDAETRDPARYEHVYAHVDVLVAGGGVAGLAAARAAARTGASVMVLEQSGWWGGRTLVDGGEIDGTQAADWIDAALRDLGAMPNVRLRSSCTVSGIYDHGWVLAAERPAQGPLERLWKIRAERTVMATGAIERPLTFADNDRPGVMLAGAVRDYLDLWAVAPGRQTVVVTNNDDGYRTALALADAGLGVAAVVDPRPEARGALPEAARRRGLPIRSGRSVVQAEWRGTLRSVRVSDADDGAGAETLACDALAMSGGWSPAVHLWSQAGGKLVWDEAGAMFRPDHARPPTGDDGAAKVIPAGAADGEMSLAAALASGHAAGRAAAEATGHQPVSDEAPAAARLDEAPLLPAWIMPRGAGRSLRAKAFLDFQNDVKVADVELAAREGYQSVEHAKRYTTLGMATDQGKLSNINGLAVLSHALGEPIPQVGTTTFRPPYVPLTMGAIAGEARGTLFQPVRKTPLHDRHEALGAAWEPVGLWRRPYSYPRAGETRDEAAERETRAVREAVGVLDASTLGKIVVQGPHAGAFLDLVYTGRPSTIAEGRCRYGLICDEQGFLIDDGVIARLGPRTWLCHTTTGGAERIHGHMEEWLQTEWWDLQVHTLNVTEQWGQIAVAGPDARAVLERLGGMDVSAATLPFMRWVEGRLADVPVRVFRISFSGELSFEIAAPASRIAALWDRVLDAGATPYGTEAMHILRAEKGFVMIGEETDGTVIPQDLGLDWAIADKPDFIGKRGQMRSHMTGARWRLVGIESPDGAVIPAGSYAATDGVNANGQRNVEGRITSSYWSPTLGRGIAMALVARGPERMGETLAFPQPDGGEHRGVIVAPVVYDPDGERLRG